MPEETTTQQPADASNLFGVSMRAWLALLIVSTVCVMELAIVYTAYRDGRELTVDEPLYSMAVMTLGFYFGQKTQQK